MATSFKKFSKPLPKHTHCHIICHVHRNKREVSNYGMKDTWCWLLPSLLTFPVLLQSPSWSMSGNLLQRDHHGQYLQYSCIGQLCLLTFRDITDFELNLASFLKVSLSVFPDKKKRAKMYQGSQNTKKQWHLPPKKSTACSSEYHINSMLPFTECRQAECTLLRLWCSGLFCSGSDELY